MPPKGRRGKKDTRKKAGKRRPRSSGIVANASLRGTATTSIRGTAQGDTISALPLLGTKFENKRMLYYEYGLELKDGAGLIDTWFFGANDVYDPDTTGTGHQVIGFDQAMLFWEQFVVYSAKISISFVSNSNAALRVGVFLNADTVTPSTRGELIENGFNKSVLVFGSDSGAEHTVHRINFTANNIKYFGQKGYSNYMSNSVFTGTAAASPSERNYFGVFAYCMTGSVNYSVLFDVIISFDVQFWEPRKISQSLASVCLRQIITEQNTPPTHEQKVRELRDALRKKNPRYGNLEFAREMKEAGLWQPQDCYRQRRTIAYQRTASSHSGIPSVRRITPRVVDVSFLKMDHPMGEDFIDADIRDLRESDVESDLRYQRMYFPVEPEYLADALQKVRFEDSSSVRTNVIQQAVSKEVNTILAAQDLPRTCAAL